MNIIFLLGSEMVAWGRWRTDFPSHSYFWYPGSSMLSRVGV